MARESKTVKSNTLNGMRMGQLLQVWRDYYDEIFDVNIEDGSFETLMGGQNSFWTTSGYSGIEVILLAEKNIHPDDKENFKTFFDIDRIRKNVEKGIYVTKLNFRIQGPNSDHYSWVKVKNIVPSKQDGSGPLHFFACFRKVDKEAVDDIQFRRDMADGLAKANEALGKRNDLLTRMFKEVKSPLNGIIGMIGLAASDGEIDPVLRERLAKIENETIKLNVAINGYIREFKENSEEEPLVTETELPKVNRISYVQNDDRVKNERETESEADIPENFIFNSENDTSGVPADAKEKTFDFSGHRILVVEDNELNLEVITELLQSTGAKVDTAMDGKQAVVRFVSKPAGTYDLILMDIDIPVLDGYSAARCIRICGKDDCGTVPIYAVTSNNFVEDINKSVECGFNAFFAKPVDFSILFSKIEEDFASVKEKNDEPECS